MQTAPEDLDALEGMSVSYASLGQYKEAAEGLEKLATAKPKDIEVWRLLAEVRTALEQDEKAASAY